MSLQFERRSNPARKERHYKKRGKKMIAIHEDTTLEEFRERMRELSRRLQLELYLERQWKRYRAKLLAQARIH